MPTGVYTRILGKTYGMTGKRHSEESRRKMSGTRTGIVFSEERNRKISIAKTGIKRGPQ
jgi:hypothetical protein